MLNNMYKKYKNQMLRKDTRCKRKFIRTNVMFLDLIIEIITVHQTYLSGLV